MAFLLGVGTGVASRVRGRDKAGGFLGVLETSISIGWGCFFARIGVRIVIGLGDGFLPLLSSRTGDCEAKNAVSEYELGLERRLVIFSSDGRWPAKRLDLRPEPMCNLSSLEL